MKKLRRKQGAVALVHRSEVTILTSGEGSFPARVTHALASLIVILSLSLSLSFASTAKNLIATMETSWKGRDTVPH